jgi:hypothetical protein
MRSTHVDSPERLSRGSARALFLINHNIRGSGFICNDTVNVSHGTVVFFLLGEIQMSFTDFFQANLYFS